MLRNIRMMQREMCLYTFNQCILKLLGNTYVQSDQQHIVIVDRTLTFTCSVQLDQQHIIDRTLTFTSYLPIHEQCQSYLCYNA